MLTTLQPKLKLEIKFEKKEDEIRLFNFEKNRGKFASCEVELNGRNIGKLYRPTENEETANRTRKKALTLRVGTDYDYYKMVGTEWRDKYELEKIGEYLPITVIDTLVRKTGYLG